MRQAFYILFLCGSGLLLSACNESDDKGSDGGKVPPASCKVHCAP